MVTFFCLGYGETFPITALGRSMMIFVIIVGLTTTTMFISTLIK